MVGTYIYDLIDFYKIKNTFDLGMIESFFIVKAFNRFYSN